MTTPPPDQVTRRSVIRDAAGIGLAIGAYGLSFGALAVAGGLTVPQTCALSLLAFTGASQFAFVAVVAGGGSALTGAGNAVVLGLRNGLYGMRLAQTIEVRGWRRWLAAQVVIDETTAMATRYDDPPTARLAFRATAIWGYGCWNLATLIGALAAGGLGDPRTLGLDAAFPAAFVALLWPRLTAPRVPRERRRPRRAGTDEAPADGRPAGAEGTRLPPRVAAVVGAAIALAATPVLPAGVPVLLAGVTAVGAGLLAGRRRSGPDTATPTREAAADRQPAAAGRNVPDDRRSGQDTGRPDDGRAPRS